MIVAVEKGRMTAPRIGFAFCIQIQGHSAYSNGFMCGSAVIEPTHLQHLGCIGALCRRHKAAIPTMDATTLLEDATVKSILDSDMTNM